MKDILNTNPPIGSRLIVRNGCVFVDGKPFVVDYPDGFLSDVKDNKLIVRDEQGNEEPWDHEHIEGYYA